MMLQWLRHVFYKFIGMFTALGSLTYQPANSTSTGRFERSFTVVKKLTEGANGCPLRVKDKRKPHDEYVVKRITFTQNCFYAHSFAEVRRLTQLIHLNIVRYFDCWLEDESGSVDNTVLYVQMASYHTCLSEWLSIRHPKEVNKAPIFDWMEQIADAMKYCHQQSVTHTDLKPGNIFVSRNNRTCLETLVVGDFGVALGTRLYTSPEQAKVLAIKSEMQRSGKFDINVLLAANQKILDDKVTDVFTMGLIYAELLVSRVKKLKQIDREELFDTIRMHRQKLTDLGTYITEPELRRIIHQMTDEEPRNRSTFEQVLNEIKCFKTT